MSRKYPRSYASSTTDSSSDSEYDGERDEHILTIDVDSTKLAQGVLAAKRTVTSEFHAGMGNDREELCVAASIITNRDDRDVPSVQVVTTAPNQDTENHDSESIERWL